jgi:dTDP-4-amino-4,6-dideoxygalactose transaminase
LSSILNDIEEQRCKAKNISNPNKKHKIIGNLKNTDKIMSDSFWIGVWPGLGKLELNFIVKEIRTFISRI